MVKKLTMYAEIDEVLPLMAKLAEGRPYPFAGYLLWLMTSFPVLSIWVAYQNEKPVAYLTAGLEFTYTVKEAIIYEMYSDADNVDVAFELWQAIQEWAKENGCINISCYARNPKLADILQMRYGFKPHRVNLLLPLGG